MFHTTRRTLNPGKSQIFFRGRLDRASSRTVEPDPISLQQTPGTGYPYNARCRRSARRKVLEKPPAGPTKPFYSLAAPLATPQALGFTRPYRYIYIYIYYFRWVKGLGNAAVLRASVSV